MPTSAPKPCVVCRVLVRDGTSRCPMHKAKATGFTKLSRQARGYGSAWDKLRLVVLRRDGGVCQPCQGAGRTVLGNIVDHKVPKAEGGTDDMENLQTICKPCHARKTAFESGRGGAQVALLPKWLPEPAVPVVLVCGPPGSGKSSWCAENAGPADLVIDVDLIAAELTGKPIYHATREETIGALRVRNKMLAGLAERSAVKRCFLIATAGSPEERDFWARTIKASIHLMKTSKSECIERINADLRRSPSVRRSQIDAVRRWM